MPKTESLSETCHNRRQGKVLRQIGFYGNYFIRLENATFDLAVVHKSWYKHVLRRGSLFHEPVAFMIRPLLLLVAAGQQT